MGTIINITSAVVLLLAWLMYRMNRSASEDPRVERLRIEVEQIEAETRRIKQYNDQVQAELIDLQRGGGGGPLAQSFREGITTPQEMIQLMSVEVAPCTPQELYDVLKGNTVVKIKEEMRTDRFEDLIIGDN